MQLTLYICVLVYTGLTRGAWVIARRARTEQAVRARSVHLYTFICHMTVYVSIYLCIHASVSVCMRESRRGLKSWSA